MILPTEGREFRKAGFWMRFTAIWIDSVVVVGLTYLAVVSARVFSTYIPFELSALGFALAYSAILIGARARTIGKTICGLCVLKKDGSSVNHLTDYLTRTVVQQELASKKRGALAVLFVLGVSSFFVTLQIIEYVNYYGLYTDMLPYSMAKTPYDDREQGTVVDVSSLTRSHDSLFVQWLNTHGKTPLDYAVHVVSTHQLVVFGEAHGNRGQIAFLSKIIPDLYHRAGVRCVAMEVCTNEDNEELARLVTAREYDHDLAIQIARNQPWHSWGMKEYWDVLYAVWQLNRSLPDAEKKMRVVGIDSQWDGPSFALALAGADDAVKGPIWERLRIFRALLGLPGLVLRDELMAREVEQEIIEKGERGVVWCGANHGFINYKQPYGKGRMAYILHHKYGDKVFQILLHSKDTSPSIIDPGYSGPAPRMGDFIERIMAYRADSPTGFDVVGSPFEFLRDSTHYHYSKQPKTVFGDVASGYIFLEPRERFKGCQWIKGFITPEMFATYKPFYEGRAHRPFKTVEEADEFFKTETESKQ